MTLIDLLEMFVDWAASYQRAKSFANSHDSTIEQSMQINKERFELSDQLFDIFMNTFREIGIS